MTFRCAVLMVLTSFAPAVQADDPVSTDYGADVEITLLKPTEPATLVSMAGDHTMVASRVKVGRVADGKPLLCFKDPDRQLIGCFVLNTKTLEVAFVNLPANETGI